MTNIGHFRAAARMLSKANSIPTRLWISPPTKMDEHQLMEEGIQHIRLPEQEPRCRVLAVHEIRLELPQILPAFQPQQENANRLGDGADVYLASAELTLVQASWVATKPQGISRICE